MNPADWKFASVPPAEWQSLCDYQHALFGSSDWQRVLERGLGCRSIYGSTGHAGLVLSVFRAGPFRIGYLGFPVGGLIGDPASATELLDVLRRIPAPVRPQVIRIPVSPFGAALGPALPRVSAPETAIADLQQWSLENASTNIRRDLRKASASRISVTDARDPAAGGAIYKIYRDTVARHRGSLRYTPAYFEELIRAAQSRSDLRVMLALDDGELAAFNVVALHATSGYYLHGGIGDGHRDARPAAPLMYEAIEWCRSSGARAFNFQSSPPTQPQLVQYKEKWGGTTLQHLTFTLSFGAAGGAFQLLDNLRRLVR